MARHEADSEQPLDARLSRLTGRDLLARPHLNRGSAFTEADRDEFGLRGLLPWRVLSTQEQVELELEHIRRKDDDLEKYIGLASLRDRNETLFHLVLLENLEEFAPIVYTPTVGRACKEFSHIMRQARGVWITPDDVDRIPEVLLNYGQPDVRLIVATDNERILGLGDQGAGGMGIPVGKLELYTAGAGLHPHHTLPVSIDCGTDNDELLQDPYYLGYPKPRLRGAAYDELIEAFVEAVGDVYPHALLQWEDFKQHNAVRLLARYRHRLASFNDDIQGTAAVAVAGILAAARRHGGLLAGQRFVFVGAGAAGTGIAHLLRTVLRLQGATETEAHGAIVMLDSKGLLYDERPAVDADKRPFALTRDELAGYRLDPAAGPDLAAVVRAVAPAAIIGTSGQPRIFTERVIKAMAGQTASPLVFALSNPTSNCEADPADVLAWTDGRAVVATGSPFPPVSYDGQAREIGQANNVFVFPGVGLGATVARAREVSDGMFLAAATTLADLVDDDRLACGALYPRVADLRRVSRAVAIAVARQARDEGLGRLAEDADIEAAIDAAMWTPDYPSL